MSMITCPPIRLMHPPSRAFPIEISKENPLRISRSQMICLEAHDNVLNRMHIQEIVLVNQTAEKDLFFEAEIAIMVNAIAFFLIFKFNKDPGKYLAEVSHSERIIAASAYPVFLSKVSEKARSLGIFWKLTKTK